MFSGERVKCITSVDIAFLGISGYWAVLGSCAKVIPPSEDEEEEGDAEDKDKKKKKKKSKSRIITYDPDLDMTIVEKKHKTGDEEWEA